MAGFYAALWPEIVPPLTPFMVLSCFESVRKGELGCCQINCRSPAIPAVNMEQRQQRFVLAGKSSLNGNSIRSSALDHVTVAATALQNNSNQT